MDLLADLLARGRARGSVFARTPVERRGGIEFGGRRLLAVHTILSGEAWFERPDIEPVRLSAGDLILIPAGPPYRAVGKPGNPTTPHAGATTIDPPDTELAGRLVCGAYTMDGLLTEPLLDALPLLVPIRGETADRRLRIGVELLAAEVAAPLPGAQTEPRRAQDQVARRGLGDGGLDRRQCPLRMELHRSGGEQHHFAHAGFGGDGQELADLPRSARILPGDGQKRRTDSRHRVGVAGSIVPIESTVTGVTAGGLDILTVKA